MKSTTFIAVAAGLTASLVSAQIDNIPQCALTCALTSLSSTGCAVTDIPCICTATSFISGLVPCVQAACTEKELADTIAAAGELCSGAGASLSVPAPTGTGSGAVSSAVSTVVSVTSQVATTSVTATAVEKSTSSVVSTVIQTTKAPTTLATTAIGGGANSTVITGTAPPVPTSTEKSSAGRNAVAFGGLGAIVALVAALL